MFEFLSWNMGLKINITVFSPKVAATNKQVLDEGGVHSSGDQKNLAANTITSDKSKKVEASVKTLAEKASNLIGNAEERSKTSSLPFWVRLPQPHHEPAVAQSPMLDVQKRSLDDETSFMAKQSSSVAKNQNIDVEQDIQAETSTTATTAAAMKVPELDKVHELKIFVGACFDQMFNLQSL